MRTLATCLTVAAMSLALHGCGPGETEVNSSRYGQGGVVQGGQCFGRTRDGRLVRVAPSNCPSLTAGGQTDIPSGTGTGATPAAPVN